MNRWRLERVASLLLTSTREMEVWNDSSQRCQRHIAPDTLCHPPCSSSMDSRAYRSTEKVSSRYQTDSNIPQENRLKRIERFVNTFIAVRKLCVHWPSNVHYVHALIYRNIGHYSHEYNTINNCTTQLSVYHFIPSH